MITKRKWQKVQKEYEQDKDRWFICNASPTFVKIWNKKQGEVEDIARKFLETTKVDSLNILGHPSVLFNCCFVQHREIRLLFLQWCVEHSD